MRRPSGARWPDQSAARRPNTTVPQQSLFLMNSPFIAQQATALAARAGSAASTSPAAGIQALYRLLFQRAPLEVQLRVATDFIEAAGHTGENEKLDAWQQLAQLLLLTNEFCFVD